MFCRIKNKECESAGEVTVMGCKEFGEKNKYNSLCLQYY